MYTLKTYTPNRAGGLWDNVTVGQGDVESMVKLLREQLISAQGNYGAYPHYMAQDGTKAKIMLSQTEFVFVIEGFATA